MALLPPLLLVRTCSAEGLGKRLAQMDFCPCEDKHAQEGRLAAPALQGTPAVQTGLLPATPSSDSLLCDNDTYTGNCQGHSLRQSWKTGETGNMASCCAHTGTGLVIRNECHTSSHS